MLKIFEVTVSTINGCKTYIITAEKPSFAKDNAIARVALKGEKIIGEPKVIRL